LRQPQFLFPAPGGGICGTAFGGFTFRQCRGAGFELCGVIACGLRGGGILLRFCSELFTDLAFGIGA
jgi:hypothetical protein